MRNWVIGITAYTMIGFILFGWANNHPTFCYTLTALSYDKTTKLLEEKPLKHGLCPAYFALWWPLTIPAAFSDKLWKLHNEDK